MSKCGARMSTTLPLPSSPHWAPTTTMFFITIQQPDTPANGKEFPRAPSQSDPMLLVPVISFKQTYRRTLSIATCAPASCDCAETRSRSLGCFDSERAIDHSGDILFRGCADHAVGLASGIEQYKGGDTL